MGFVFYYKSWFGIIIIIFIIIFILFLLQYSRWVFPTIISWGSFTEVWVTTNLLKSPLIIQADFNNAVLWMVSIFLWFLFIIIIIIIIHSLQLFTPALADGFSLESEWQQVSSSLQDSSQYSGRSQ